MVSTCLKAENKKGSESASSYWLRALLIVMKDMGSIPSTSMEAHLLLRRQAHIDYTGADT